MGPSIQQMAMDMQAPNGQGFAQMSSGPGGFPGVQMPGGGMGGPGMGGPGMGGPGMHGPGMGGPGMHGPGMGGMGAPAQPNPYGRGPGDPYPPPPAVMVPPQQGGASKRVFAIVGGVVGVGLLVAVVTLFLVRKGPPEPDGPVVVSSAPTASASAGPSPPSSATPADPPPEPSPPEPATSGSAGPSEPEGPTTVAVTIVCKPQCDAVKIDGKLADFSKPIDLEPGLHSLEALKSGHLPRVERFEVKAGEPLEKVVELQVAPANLGPAPKPKCQPGQFIKKCK
jgi:hypothetical protein